MRITFFSTQRQSRAWLRDRRLSFPGCTSNDPSARRFRSRRIRLASSANVARQRTRIASFTKKTSDLKRDSGWIGMIFALPAAADALRIAIIKSKTSI